MHCFSFKLKSKKFVWFFFLIFFSEFFLFVLLRTHRYFRMEIDFAWTTGGTGEFRVYTRRWVVLAIFTLYSASNALQWIQYSIIANVVER